LRILLVTYRLPQSDHGGSEEYVDGLADALCDRYEVCVLTGTATRPTRFPVRVISRVPPLPLTPGRLHKMAWHPREQWSPARHVQIRRELARFSPSVVHSHQCQGRTAAVFSAIRAEGLPHVHTAHDSNLLCVNMRMLRGGFRARSDAWRALCNAPRGRR
jgi:hypothetical protein